MKTTVIYHSADFDGIFCREIARKFLAAHKSDCAVHNAPALPVGPCDCGASDVEFIGWDFGDPKIPVPLEGKIYILDLSPDCLDMAYGELLPAMWARIIWIDHHGTSIAKFANEQIAGYRIDGVSACRLTWQWFALFAESIGIVAQAPDQAAMPLPSLQDFIDRKVSEPQAVQLAGEYDVWDKRNPLAEVFQFGLRARELKALTWTYLFCEDSELSMFMADGRLAQFYQQNVDAEVMKARSFMVEFEGLKFLALNTSRCNSLTFAAKDVPETGHAALMGFFFNGTIWKFSLYGARHNPGLDLSAIAKKYGGGGHRQACGFEAGFWAVSFDEGSLKIADLSKAKKV